MAEDAQRRATNRHRRFARPLFPPGGIGARDMGGGRRDGENERDHEFSEGGLRGASGLIGGGAPMRIFGDLNSGNCQKVKTTADYLGVSYDWIDVDTEKGESRTTEFLALNPAGQVPTVVFDDGRALAQSNAIVRHLARGSSLIPDDPFDQAKADEWMFWEQYSHEPYVAVARFQLVYLGRDRSDLEPKLVERGERALERLELGLRRRDYLVGDRLSIADIALLPYTRLAHEGGFDLARRSAIRDWIGRCETVLRFP